jgi:hypothetical protein
VTLVDRVVEVCREPGPDPTAPDGWRCRSAAMVGPDARVGPLASPAARIAVADLLP